MFEDTRGYVKLIPFLYSTNIPLYPHYGNYYILIFLHDFSICSLLYPHFLPRTLQ